MERSELAKSFIKTGMINISEVGKGGEVIRRSPGHKTTKKRMIKHAYE